MKTFFVIALASLLASAKFCNSDKSIYLFKEKRSKLEMDKKDSLKKIDDIIDLIVNEQRLQGKIENIHYGQMASGVFNYVSNSDKLTNLNQKIELIVMMAYFQNHYIDAYASVSLVEYEKVTSETRNLNYVLSPFKILPDSLCVIEYNEFFASQLNSKNKMLFRSIDSLSALNSSSIINDYMKVLRKYINEKEFYSRYKKHFGKIPMGQL